MGGRNLLPSEMTEFVLGARTDGIGMQSIDEATEEMRSAKPWKKDYHYSGCTAGIDSPSESFVLADEQISMTVDPPKKSDKTERHKTRK
jgi:hypothetical protein